MGAVSGFETALNHVYAKDDWIGNANELALRAMICADAHDLH